MTNRCALLVALFPFAAVLVVCATAGWAQEPVWSTYHMDMGRRGQNTNSTDIANPASFNPIWVFPRGVSTLVDKEKIVVDNLDVDYFESKGWLAGLKADDPYPDDKVYSPDDFFYIPVRIRSAPPEADPPNIPKVTATWYLPADLPRGKFRIWIWVPSAYPEKPWDYPRNEFYKNTTQADYTVYDDTGKTTIKFNQQNGGGWVLLSQRFFSFTGSGNYRVEVTNETDDAYADAVLKDQYGNIVKDSRTGKDIIRLLVAVDAIRFEPATGMEIYSSPVTAKIPWSHKWLAGEFKWKARDGSTVTSPEMTFTGDIPAVYVGTIESAVSNAGDAPDTGAVYCINSITTFTTKLTDQIPDLGLNPLDGNWAGKRSEWMEAQAHASALGTTIWRYPRVPTERTIDIEGPIEGGIYSTPTLVNIGNRLVCYVAAMDRQVYALDAQTGELIWKGPGVTKGEGAPAGWTEKQGEAFGGVYHQVQCVADGGELKTASWNFPDDVRRAAGEPAADGWSYAVYAWIPAQDGLQVQRIPDAEYTVSFLRKDGPTSETVKVDQTVANQGRWVRIGGSYFNVSRVTLNNRTILDANNAADRYVVADAVMIVPDTIDAFGYSSPVWNEKTDVAGGGRIFAATSTGRILSFRLGPGGDPANRVGRMEWVYPAIRTKLVVTGSADADQPSLGELSASPAFDNLSTANGECLYVACFNGKVRCIRGVDTPTPSQAWEYPARGNEAEDPGHFTSSVAVDKHIRQLFVGDTNGVFYCLNSDFGNLNWRYPEEGGVPLGAFRYSTPVIADDSTGMHRAWIGSTDGHIYSFYASEPERGNTIERRIWAEYADDGTFRTHVKYYVESNAFGPIQGSVAFDGTVPRGGHPIMFIGDMRDQGSLHWYRADTGLSDWQYQGKYYQSYRLDGLLFSSPNVTQFRIDPKYNTTEPTVSYVMIGSSSGRIIAFSHERGAWGGGWSGGDWPLQGTPEGSDNKEEQIAPNTNIQFEMITRDFYEKTRTMPNSVFELTTTQSGKTYHQMPATWDPDWLISRQMKQPTADLMDKDLTSVIEPELLKLAKERRNAVDSTGSKAVFGLDKRLNAAGDQAVYFEWGEKICVAIWNLPPMAFLYGDSPASKRANLQNGFRFVNTGPGSGSGSTTRLPATVSRLEEYTVLDYHKLTATGTPAIDYYKELKDSTGSVVKRCFALAEVEIRENVQRPPSPGEGWVLSIEVRKKQSTAKDAPTSVIRLPIAKLIMKGGVPEPVFVAYESANAPPGTIGEFKEQMIGINNPLAIRDDNDGNMLVKDPLRQIAWPDVVAGPGGTRIYVPNRDDPEAHYNGNRSETPLLNLNFRYTSGPEGVAHGTTSREARLGVMDRSAVGTQGRSIDNFRIEAGDLGWRGGEEAIGRSFVVNGIARGQKFPWELGIGSADYPNIPRTRQSFRQQSNDTDPSRSSSKLPACIGTDYDNAALLDDWMYLSVSVPKYQPANMNGDGTTGAFAQFGYSKVMRAYIDSDRNGSWESGNPVVGRPVTYQEAYRSFRTGLRVPPDPRIEVDEQLVDVGQAAHGLGVGYDFVAVNPHPDVRQWFKKITIKNAGNVNLYNVRVAKSVPLLMVRDVSGTFGGAPLIPGIDISSSLDWELPSTPYLRPLVADPFIYNPHGNASEFSYTLTKPRVGDADPTVMSIPDKRKWDMSYGGTPAAAEAALRQALQAFGAPPGEIEYIVKNRLPFSTEVSVRVPLGQPIGTYQAPFVPVWCDLDGNTQLDPGEPFAAPTFQLKVTVRESRMTGDRQAGSLFQIDEPLPGTNYYARVGDSTPAAFKCEYTVKDSNNQDRKAMAVNLFWSSNRMFDTSLYPDWGNPADPKLKDFAGAPWLIDQARLAWNPAAQSWQAAGTRWWEIPAVGNSPYLPVFLPGGAQWPPLLPVWGTGASVMPWKFGGKDTGFDSVRHYSPTIAIPEYDWPDPTARSNRAVLAWAGTANVIAGDGTVGQEHRLFYVDASGGLVKNDAAQIRSIDRDPKTEKRHPSSVVLLDWGGAQGSSGLDRMWMFWQGADADRWSIYYATNDKRNSGPRSDFPSDNWSPSYKLRTPDCLVSAGSPNAVRRAIGDYSKPQSSPGKSLIDMVYDGTTKLRQTPDILLTRYLPLTIGDIDNIDGASSGVLPSRAAQPMPRIYGEKLQRDSRYGFFTSEHLAWIRPSRQSLNKLAYFTPGEVSEMLADHTGRKAHEDFVKVYDGIIAGVAPNSRSGLWEFYNMPHIWVVLPDGYTAGGKTFRAGAIVSATDGIIPEIDEATGILSYKYPEDSDAAKVLGETIADLSTGIIRFKNPLAEVKVADGTVAAPEVYADYTPQSWRLTTDPAVDNSPRAFIERTPMNTNTNPGMCKWTGDARWNKVDRLWVLWRKAGTGVTSSTIFWKTYRIGIDLTKLSDKDGKPSAAVKWSTDSNGNPVINPGDVSVTDALGPWEVDRTGTRIYFTELDERYSSMLQTAAREYYLSGEPRCMQDTNGDGQVDAIKPITIRYRNIYNQFQTLEAAEISWIPETSERSLFGYATDSSVNEGSIYAFSDPGDMQNDGTLLPPPYSKIWVFWTSTRGGTSDLCWATLSPSFAAK